MPAAPPAPPAPIPPPAPAPALTPSPSPAPAPTPSPEPKGDESFEGAFRELDGLDDGKPVAESPKAKKEKAKVIPPPEPKPSDPTPIPSAEPAEPAEPVSEKEPSTIQDLRKAFREGKKTIKDLQGKLTSNEEQLTAARKAPAGAEQLKPLQDEIASLKARNEQVEQLLEYTDFAKSQKFQKDFATPYNEAWQKAIGEITQFQIKYDGPDGEVSRKATPEDIMALASAPLDQVDVLAEAWFGRAAHRVIRHVEKIKDLAEAQHKALADAQKNSGERMKERQTSTLAAAKKSQDAYEGTTNQIATKYPKWFAEDKTDPEGTTLFTKGLEYVDSVFKPNGNPLPGEQRASRLAIIRMKAANHDRLARQNKTLRTDLAEAHKTIAEYEGSAPPAGGGKEARGKGGKSYLESANDEIDSLDKPQL